MRIIKVLLIACVSIHLGQSCIKSDPASQPVPTITNIEPSRDSAGAYVTIHGGDFSNISTENIVKFNNLPATVISAALDKLVVQVPAGSPGEYTVTVTTRNKTSESSNKFEIVLNTQKLIEGRWRYAKSARSDTTYFPSPIPMQPWPFGGLDGISFDLDTNYNYLKFTAGDTLHSFQSSWGTGQAGRWYADTIKYVIDRNSVYLSYPAGINTEINSAIYFYDVPLHYPAYTDTILIKELTPERMVIKRNYHYKHYGWTEATHVKKESLDSLVRF